MTDHSMMKLGRRGAVYQPRRLALAKYTVAMPGPPAAAGWSKYLTNLGPMLNETLSDCTAAAVGHGIQIMTAANGNQVIVPDSAILALYEGSCGYNPSDPSTDQGGYINKVQDYWRTNGVDGHTIDGYASCSLRSTSNDVQDAIAYFGFCNIGVNLPISAQTQEVWDVGGSGDTTPGSWGGHDIILTDYDSSGFTCVTWGAMKKLTWAWFQTYCDEAYAILSKDWASSVGSPAGKLFDWAALDADLAAFSG